MVTRWKGRDARVLIAAGAALLPVSVGVASGLHTTVAALIRAAGEALYRDKAGRRAAAAAQPAGTPR